MTDQDPFVKMREEATSLFANIDHQPPVADLVQVLFVDDERSVLDGLRRMLRPMRHVWSMRFANSGPEALAMLAEEPADVVVSDLRMPEMPGDVLLEQVKERFPNCIRLILSGDATRSQIFKTVGPAHQFLSKPCEPEDLKRAIDHAGTMRGALTSKALQGIVARMESIPSLPSLYRDLQDVLRAENVSLKRVAEIIARDPGMTAKILKLVNSAFFGLRRTINSPEQAVNILGLETIHALVLSTQAFDVFEPFEGLDADALAEHNLRVGVMSKELVTLEGGTSDDIESAFVAGLLHDVGRLILATNFTEQYAWLCQSAAKHGVPIHLAEQKVFHADHGEVGAYLLGLWGLSDTIVEAVALHHRPGSKRGDQSLILLALHVADHADHLHRRQDNISKIDRQAFVAAGLEDRLRDWAACCGRVIRDHSDDGVQS